VRWRICQAAVLFFVLNLLATSTLHNVEIADGASLPVQRADGSSETLSTVEEESWDTVESFRELRRRQAYLLRLQL